MDPAKGHDLAKLSTCTTCEMAEDFSASLERYSEEEPLTRVPVKR